MHLKESCFRDQRFTRDTFNLTELIGRGRYGTVWKDNAEGDKIAVKIFASRHKSYFRNEVDIYEGPLISHPSLLSYLVSNVLDWNACKMALSVAIGLAHLHADITRGGELRNGLPSDPTCPPPCLLEYYCLFQYYWNGEERRAYLRSINDVRFCTLRYMSPEVLDGAVNLRDCETALKQIDVYALVLILWEMSTRCKDLYIPGTECLSHRLPFQLEIGDLGDSTLIARTTLAPRKRWPLFPETWTDSVTLRSIKETIEDSWDQDAEARLTAVCVQERFRCLSTLLQTQTLVNTHKA